METAGRVEAALSASAEVEIENHAELTMSLHRRERRLSFLTSLTNDTVGLEQPISYTRCDNAAIVLPVSERSRILLRHF